MGYRFPSAVLPARYGLTRFLFIQTEPLPRGGVCTSEPVNRLGSGEGGGRGSGVAALGRSSRSGGGLFRLTRSPNRGMTTSYSGQRRCRPRIAACLLGSNNGGPLQPLLG